VATENPRQADRHPGQDGEGVDARPGAEARNIAHQMKKLGTEELKKFRDTLELPDSRPPARRRAVLTTPGREARR
jgi:pyruvate dehydrogenase complex dehydrogenase (E1) component